MGREEPVKGGSVSSFDLRILMTWIRKEMLRMMTTITGTAKNNVDDLNISLSCKFVSNLELKILKKTEMVFRQADYSEILQTTSKKQLVK